MTQYKCDGCGKEYSRIKKRPEELYSATFKKVVPVVNTTFEGIKYTSSKFVQVATRDFCRECLKTVFGIDEAEMQKYTGVKNET